MILEHAISAVHLKLSSLLNIQGGDHFKRLPERVKLSTLQYSLIGEIYHVFSQT